MVEGQVEQEENTSCKMHTYVSREEVQPNVAHKKSKDRSMLGTLEA